MNPETNRFEQLHPAMKKRKASMALEQQLQQELLRPDGKPVPTHWIQFHVGELVVIKDYTFRVAYIGETVILFEPVGIVLPETK